MPVSLTSNRILAAVVVSDSCETRKTTLPSLVNLIALSRRCPDAQADPKSIENDRSRLMSTLLQSFGFSNSSKLFSQFYSRTPRTDIVPPFSAFWAILPIRRVTFRAGSTRPRSLRARPRKQ